MSSDTAEKSGSVRRPRKRIAKGPPRPGYFESPDLDRLMIMFVAMLSELLAVRDRLETHEYLLERDGALSAVSIEAFRPTPEFEAERESRRLVTLRRIFRVLHDEFESEAPQTTPTAETRS
jgi:hypothetical protein